jgi:hypothetical protein
VSEHKPIVLRTCSNLLKDRYGDVLDRAEKGDRSVLPQVREILDEFPAVIDDLGDLSGMVRAALLDKMDDGDTLIREAEKRKLSDLTEGIEGACPTFLERLLAEQIVLCWQQLRLVEALHAQTHNYTLTEGEYFHRCIDKAQRRYLAAIKTLAQVRKPEVPTMQVNIAAEGGQQVNMSAR